MEEYNPNKARYIEDFLRRVSRLWELRDDLKSEPGMENTIKKVDKITDSYTLRWKLFDLIGRTYSISDLNKLRRRYFVRLEKVSPDVLDEYQKRFRKLEKEHQGMITYDTKGFNLLQPKNAEE